MPIGLVAQQEELDLRVRVEGEAHLRRLAEVALEHPAGVGVGRRAVRHQDVAEHPGHTRVLTPPREQLERRRVGPGDHVRLVHPGETLDRGPVEADAVGERALEFGRRDGDGLERAEHVGEPEPDETNIPLFERAQHEFFLPIHGYHLRRFSRTLHRQMVGSRYQRKYPARVSARLRSGDRRASRGRGSSMHERASRWRPSRQRSVMTPAPGHQTSGTRRLRCAA